MIFTRKTLHIAVDEGHKLGGWSKPSEHGDRTCVCRGCGGLVVEHADGKVDPERHLLSMTCEEAQKIGHVADAVVGAGLGRRK